MSVKTLHAEWNAFLEDELKQDYFQSLTAFVNDAYRKGPVYPPANQVFRAFNLCLPAQVKVVIIGQDPYHQAGQANGLCFSVNAGIKLPPSLKNIFKELESDLPGWKSPDSGELEPWAGQGVLLLNAVLSVADSMPGSHKDCGWQRFTDAVITKLSKEKEHLVFMLWGNYAQSKASLIDQNKHLVLMAAHPSPLARGAFFGNRHFSKANTYLKEKDLKEIDWSLT